MPTNPGTTITEAKAEPGLVGKFQLRPVLVVPVQVPVCPYAASAVMIMSQSGVSGWTSLAIPICLWTMRTETRHPVRLISSIQILDDEKKKQFLLMIRKRALSYIGVVILNLCPCGLWIALPVSWTQWKTVEMPPCDSPIFLDIAHWDSPSPDHRTISSRIPGGILAGMIATLFWNCNLCATTAHSWMYSIQMRHTVFGATREIHTPQERTDWDRTESAVDCEIL